METPAVETGVVVKLDRGFPLVRLGDGRELRCEHATSLVKGSDQRAVVGDVVRISLPDGHDKGIIEETLPQAHVVCAQRPYRTGPSANVGRQLRPGYHRPAH